VLPLLNAFFINISMSIHTIYRIVNNINGKVYIGYDSKWPNRKKGHIYHAKDRNQYIYQSLRKYGIENFTWEPIYQSKDGKHCLNVMESYFIKEYDSFNSGYNLTLGGEGTLGRPTKDITRSKISQALKNKPKSKEHIQKMSDTRKGKVPSYEALKQRSESMKRTLQLKRELSQS
jgi:group I intron endonuclease